MVNTDASYVFHGFVFEAAQQLRDEQPTDSAYVSEFEAKANQQFSAINKIFNAANL